MSLQFIELLSLEIICEHLDYGTIVNFTKSCKRFNGLKHILSRKNSQIKDVLHPVMSFRKNSGGYCVVRTMLSNDLFVLRLLGNPNVGYLNYL